MKLALAIVIASGLFFAFFPWIERFFIFYPESGFESVPSDWGLVSRDVTFSAEDGVLLHGWFFPLKENAPVILFCHGNAGNISHRLDNIRRLLRHHLQVFIFDYRGYGKSGGKPSEAGLYKDGLAAYDFLVNQEHVPPDMVVPFGRSLGASVAVEISIRRRVRSLVIESAFTSTKGIAHTILLFKPVAFFLPPHYNNLGKIPRVFVPKLFIHGTEDRIVPFFMGKRLFDAAMEPKYIFSIQGAGHNDTYIVGGKPYFETLSAFVRDSRI